MSNQKRAQVLILCTGNSARSQMAEGLVNHYLGERFEAQSAGTEPAARVHPEAIAALQELGIDISQALPKSVEVFRGVPFDLVITVCDHAAETCPIWLGQGQRVHLGFPDPAAAPPAEAAARFRTVRDALRERLLGYLQEWRSEAPGAL